MSGTVQYSFERYEKKYFLTPEQQRSLFRCLRSRVREDSFGQHTVYNIYYDTDDWRLIRASVEKPVYKEKLRVRSYGIPEQDGEVFVELKKKYAGIVYKRRISADICSVEPFLAGHLPGQDFGQIGREIAWFQKCWKAKPKVWIAYDRVGYEGSCDPELRITFDRNMRWRDTGLDLRLGDYGKPLLYGEDILMEIKIPGVCPLWLSHLLSENGIFPVSFSKYGSCYRDHLLRKERNEKEKEGICCA